MKLYLISGRYYGTQADAKPAAAEAGIKASQIGDHEVDVPTDKAGLIGYLNNMTRSVYRAADQEVERAIPPAPPAPTPTPHLDRALHNIRVEEEIAKADFPNAVRLAEHANSRVAEHLRDIKNEANRASLSGLLS